MKSPNRICPTWLANTNVNKYTYNFYGRYRNVKQITLRQLRQPHYLYGICMEQPIIYLLIEFGWLDLPVIS